MAKKPVVLPRATSEILVLLRVFNELADTLYEFDFHREATAPGNGFNITFEPGSVEGKRVGASKQMTAATLLVLRQLVQEQDKIQFEQLVEMHALLPIPDDLKQRSLKTLDELRRYRKQWTGLTINGWKPTNKDIFETFLYGKYAHRKREHIENYTRLMDGPFAAMIECEFENIVLAHIEVALWYKCHNQRIISLLESVSVETKPLGE